MVWFCVCVSVCVCVFLFFLFSFFFLLLLLFSIFCPGVTRVWQFCKYVGVFTTLPLCCVGALALLAVSILSCVSDVLVRVSTLVSVSCGIAGGCICFLSFIACSALAWQSACFLWPCSVCIVLVCFFCSQTSLVPVLSWGVCGFSKILSHLLFVFGTTWRLPDLAWLILSSGLSAVVWTWPYALVTVRQEARHLFCSTNDSLFNLRIFTFWFDTDLFQVILGLL